MLKDKAVYFEMDEHVINSYSCDRIAIANLLKKLTLKIALTGI